MNIRIYGVQKFIKRLYELQQLFNEKRLLNEYFKEMM